MIEFRSVRKQYSQDELLAVKDATFKIEQGEFVFFVGPSGSGKSTLLKMVYKAEMPSEGEVFIFHKETKKIKTKLLRRNIGVVFQDFQLLKNKTAYENVAYVLESLGRNPRDIKKMTWEALEKVGISDQAKKYPQYMSGGEQQRLAIARAIVNKPKIIVCDEPTGNLDEENAELVMHYLEELNKEGATILMSTHNTQFMEKLKKKTIYVSHGIAKLG